MAFQINFFKNGLTVDPTDYHCLERKFVSETNFMYVIDDFTSHM